MNVSPETPDVQQIIEYLKRLEKRVARLEHTLELQPTPDEEEALPPLLAADTGNRGESLELHIGEYWLSKTGIVILSIGVAFLLTLPFDNFPAIVPSLLGYAIVGGVIILSHFWKNTYAHLSRYLMGGGLILLFFTTMRLHFFSAEPVITSRMIEVLLLLIVVAVSLTVSLRRSSVYLCAFSLTMGYITALTSENPYFIFIMLTLLSAVVVYCGRTYRWDPFIIFGIAATYFTHFIWFVNNPLMTNTFKLAIEPSINLYFILIYAILFATGILFRQENKTEDNAVIISSFFNLVCAYGLYLVLTLTTFQASLTFHHLLASALFLGLAVAFWARERSRFSTFFYAMTGYSALSVAIIGQFENPDFFMWLCWQSLLVISTAIWFRSKFIIVANFLIYVVLFAAYLALAGKIGIVSLSFGLVALLSARILNWRKDRLALQTELMRNAYLATALVIFPYALYHMVPVEFVSLSWVGITVAYYLISRLLNNTKYRWLALLTLFLTVVRVFMVDTTNLDPGIRVASFLVLGSVLLISSMIYTRMRKKSSAQNKEN